MKQFLSCDWGTSKFRLRLIDAESLQIIAEEKSDDGIANCYQLWKQNGGDVLQRESFFIKVIRQFIEAIALRLQLNLDTIPVILSGMASSNIGMVDLPYKRLSFNIDGSDLEIKLIKTDRNPYLIISGASTRDDVMRGEETKVIGCYEYLKNHQADLLLVLPGTHSKHILIQNHSAIDFCTYMTGEFFNLLATKSILSSSLNQSGNLHNIENKFSFNDGVLAGKNGNLLHGSFMVRTNQILKQLPSEQNYHYLSGLLIGTELGSIEPGRSVVLVSGNNHYLLYSLALKILGLSVVNNIDADLALIKGQRKIFSKYF